MLVHLRLRGETEPIVARCPTDHAGGAKIGEQVGLVFGADDVLVFDGQTGRRLAARRADPVREKLHA